MRHDRGFRRWNREDGRGEGRVIVGLIVIALGVLFLLENLGYVYIRDLWDFWPVFLILLGASRMANCRGPRGLASGLIVVAIGGIFLAHNLGYIPFDIARAFWPVILILFGVGLLIRGFDGPRWQRQRDWQGAGFRNPNVAGDTANSTSQIAVLGGSRRRVISQDYQGGDALAILGGIQLDLRSAGTPRPEIHIDANALFGGVDIRVPDDWNVTIRGMGIFGGFDDMSRFREPQPGKPNLVVTGTAMFGGVRVKS